MNTPASWSTLWVVWMLQLNVGLLWAWSQAAAGTLDSALIEGIIAYKPRTVADSATPLPAVGEKMLMRLIGSDFLFLAGLQVARKQVIRYVLATPPEQVAAASTQERARVLAMADHILPVSRRAQGLRDDSVLGRSLGPYALETIRAPTLIVSARDDYFGTYAAAQYTASRITGAKFIGFDSGGHVLVGHDEAVRAEIVQLLTTTTRP